MSTTSMVFSWRADASSIERPHPVARSLPRHPHPAMAVPNGPSIGEPLVMRLAWMSILLFAGCDATTPRTRADVSSEGLDVSSEGLDAPALFDAGPFDGGTLDAFRPFDAFMGMDASWGPCMLGGAMGTCLPTSLCTMGSMPVMGLCPGPADIQCCLPGTDAGPRPDGGGAITPAEVLARLGACTRIGGDYATDVGEPSTLPICQTDSVIWWSADFDVDCDGGRGAICMSDPDYLPDTSAVDSMGNPLDASTLPFIVIPLASTRFRYADHGIRAGQVAAVLYRDRIVFGIFGDAGPAAILGEGSFAMAEALGIPSSPRTGGVDSGVTYLVFTGTAARVTRNEDHAEAVRLGEPLLEAFARP